MNKNKKIIKCEWWELWHVKPGDKPWFIKMYGQSTLDWIPDGAFPSKQLVLEEKNKRDNKYDKIIHVRRTITL
jgi:hypothetical protein